MTCDLHSLLSHTVPGGPDGNCLIWTRAIDKRGYGSASYGGRSIGAHRAVLLEIHGSIPKGHYACHTCDVKACVNPAHLYIGTPSDNVADAWARSRKTRVKTEAHRAALSASMKRRIAEGQIKPLRGRQVGTSKITDDIARGIIDAYPDGSIRTVAQQFGVSFSAVQRIISGAGWTHVRRPILAKIGRG